MWLRILRWETSHLSVQLLSRVWLYATPWTAAHQASLSIASSQSLLKLMSIESVMPSNHLILCHPLLLLPSILPRCSVWGFPGGTVVKNLPANAGDARDAGSVPGMGRFSGVGKGNPLLYSFLDKYSYLCPFLSMGRGAWWAHMRSHHKESDTTELTRVYTHT